MLMNLLNRYGNILNFSMKNINITIFTYLIVGLSILIYFSFLLYLGLENLTIKDYFSPVLKVISIISILILFFSKYLWKCQFFYDWLVPFPNLNGTFKGEIISTWINPKTGKRPDPIPCTLTINQSFLQITCIMRTGEMTSYSFNEDFILDKNKQLKQLCYSYDSTPKSEVRERSPKHSGTIKFSIHENPLELVGEYWTERKTTGDIKLKFWQKEKLDNYPDSLKKHPLSN